MTTNVETTESKIRRIISFEIGVNDDQMTGDASLVNDLGADSLDLVEIILACEEEFSMEIPDEEVRDLETVQQLVAYIEKRRAS